MVETKKEQKVETPRADFVGVLAEIRNGNVLNECSTKLTELLQAIYDTRGPGEINVKLKIKPVKQNKMGGVSELEIEPDVTIKKPEPKIGKSLFYVTEDQVLSRTDPAQREMFEGGE